MVTLQELEREVEEIKVRNKKVEIDKAWEISWTRKLLLIVFTYLAIGIYLKTIQIPNPWINAVVPTVAFYLSTLTLSFFRNLWERHIHKKF